MTSASLEQLRLWLDSHLEIYTFHYQWAHDFFNIDGTNDKRCSTILISSSTSRTFLPRSLHKTSTHKPNSNNLLCGTLYILKFQHMRTCRLWWIFNAVNQNIHIYILFLSNRLVWWYNNDWIFKWWIKSTAK